MTDYQMSSGAGLLMIRDTGGYVEYWVKAGYTNFYWDGLSFTITTNGTSYPVSINYPSGANWFRVGAINVTDSQTVTFRLNTATGTNSLAGPTSFSHYIDRGAAPNPPSAVRLSNVGSDRISYAFTDGDNNGVAIDDHELYWNTANTLTGARSGHTAMSGQGTVTGLSSGVRWYFWARSHNPKGWSGFSPVSSAVTLRVPYAPSNPVISQITQNSVHTKFGGNGDGGSPITKWELAYGRTSDVNTATIVVGGWSGDNDLLDLDAGRTYYFWARGVNAIGNGPWSGMSSATLIAGAYVYYNGGPKRAVPYVNVNGVWQVAKPWVRSAGSWKEMAQ